MARRKVILPTQSTPSPSETEPLAFPKALINPPKSQVLQYEDAVSERIIRLDLYAQKLGAGFGIPMTDFELNSLDVPAKASAGEAFVFALSALVHASERIFLEKRDGRWGLYFTRIPSALAVKDARQLTVRLQDAPLDVRERFLEVSEQFFRCYLKRCEHRLGKMQSAVASADRTLQLLENIHLE